MSNPNLYLLQTMARRLKRFLDDFVFVGGCATGLLVTDPGSTPVRASIDVDVMVNIVSHGAYYLLADELRSIGFREDNTGDAPICRWQIDGMLLDVLPTNASILGFSNIWYPEALLHAQTYQLDADLRIRLITAPYFLATKLEAFHGRGNGDYFCHDLEDFITVVDGRPELLDELANSNSQLRAYLSSNVFQLLSTKAFLDALPGFLPGDQASQARLPALQEKLRRMCLVTEKP